MSLPAKMKKIRSKMKALEWPQDKMLLFLVLTGSQWWDLAEILNHLSFYRSVFVNYKNEEDPMKK